MKNKKVHNSKHPGRRRTGIEDRPIIPYVRIFTPGKGKGAKNDRSDMKKRLRQET